VHNHHARRRALAATALAASVTIVASLGVAAPAQAADIVRFTQTDPVVTETLQPCGAVLSYVGTHRVMVRFDAQGNFVRAVQQDLYTGTITYQGKTYRADDRQVHLQYIDRNDLPVGVLNGQGLFTRLPGIGVAFFDVGHLVFDDETGETLMKSNKVVGLDEEFDFGAEVCAALTSG